MISLIFFKWVSNNQSVTIFAEIEGGGNIKHMNCLQQSCNICCNIQTFIKTAKNQNWILMFLTKISLLSKVIFFYKYTQYQEYQFRFCPHISPNQMWQYYYFANISEPKTRLQMSLTCLYLFWQISLNQKKHFRLFDKYL